MGRVGGWRGGRSAALKCGRLHLRAKIPGPGGSARQGLPRGTGEDADRACCVVAVEAGLALSSPRHVSGQSRRERTKPLQQSCHSARDRDRTEQDSEASN